MLIYGIILRRKPLPLFSFHDQRRLKSLSSFDPDDHADHLDPGATALTHDEFLPQTLRTTRNPRSSLPKISAIYNDIDTKAFVSVL
jgi:hypothetical protein